MTDATSTPTIEQVAEALGEPWAHLAPRQVGNPSGGPPLLWWTLCTERGPVARMEWQPDTAHCIAGPTRADALRAAWAYITSRQEKSE